MRSSVLIAGCVSLFMATPMAFGAEEKSSGHMDHQAMMETYQKLATPAEPHKRLAKLAGKWTTETKEWMEPGKPPRESTGMCEQRMLLDGRYLQQECTGEMMGQPFKGIGVTGYDNYAKKYVSTWMDSMGTGIFVMEGTASQDGTITLNGRHDDPYEGRMEHRAVWKFPDPNRQLFELYGAGKDGKEMKMLEITYKRKP